MTLDLNQILKDAEEYEKVRDAATSNERRCQGNAKHEFADTSQNEYFRETAGNVFGLFVAESVHNTEPNTEFIAVIRQLVERVKELEDCLKTITTKIDCIGADVLESMLIPFEGLSNDYNKARKLLTDEEESK